MRGDVHGSTGAHKASDPLELALQLAVGHTGCGRWEWNPEPLQKQYVLLTSGAISPTTVTESHTRNYKLDPGSHAYNVYGSTVPPWFPDWPPSDTQYLTCHLETQCLGGSKCVLSVKHGCARGPRHMTSVTRER